MKPMICTIRSGIRRRRRPTSTSCGSVVAASVRDARTPSVPLTTSAQAAHRPGSETDRPSTVVRGPSAMKGTAQANSTNGVSMSIRLARWRTGTPLTATTADRSSR